MIYFVFLFLFFCVTVTALVFFVEILPVIRRKIQKRKKPLQLVQNIDAYFESIILSAAFDMARSTQVTMVWEDLNNSFIEKTVALLKRNTGDSEEFRMFNYPRAFLLLGLVSYIIKDNNKKLLDNFKFLFDQYIRSDGQPSFKLSRIDQAPFGEVALKLYEVYGEEKYLRFADEIFKYLKQNIDPVEQIIDYRPGIQIVLNDMIGLTVPFLLNYGLHSKNSDAIKIAEFQMEYFLKYGSDNLSHLPAHGIDKKTKVKIGSANWGRGIGWYFMGLSICAKKNNRFLPYAYALEKSLEQLKNKDCLWTQFPGSSNRFDASTTIMLLYSILLNNPEYQSQPDLLNVLKPYLSEDGFILETSGDTYGLNDYSKTFGPSELSQGILLLLLAELKK